jgi:carbamate kinase
MKVVIALGGNALLRRGERPTAEAQQRNVELAADAIAEVARDHDVVVTHGNGPQVGLLALQAAAYADIPAYPLDVLGAESEGMIGYLLDQGLANRLPGRRVATLLTQVVVDPVDPAFGHPTKPIGPVYSAEEAPRLATERGWTIAPDGESWRRVVPSPEPCEIVELETIRLLVGVGVLVICSGGGGIPVVRAGDALHGVEAVIDKDLSAALLAERLGSDMLVMLTDVPAIMAGWGTPEATPIRAAITTELRSVRFAPGSMGPKVEAACRFVERTGGHAAIGALADAAAIVRGESGTVVVREL